MSSPPKFVCLDKHGPSSLYSIQSTLTIVVVSSENNRKSDRIYDVTGNNE